MTLLPVQNEALQFRQEDLLKSRHLQENQGPRQTQKLSHAFVSKKILAVKRGLRQQKKCSSPCRKLLRKTPFLHISCGILYSLN